MRCVSQGDRLVVGAGLILLQALVGCASSSEIKELDAGLSQKMVSLDNSVQSEVLDLRQELKAVEAAQEKRHAEIAQTIKDLRADTKAIVQEITEGEAERTEILEELREDLSMSFSNMI